MLTRKGEPPIRSSGTHLILTEMEDGLIRIGIPDATGYAYADLSIADAESLQEALHDAIHRQWKP